MANIQYIGARYVPIVYTNPDDNSANWKSGVEYESLTIVTYNGDSYTSKKAVPDMIGAPPANPDYWIKTGDFNASLLALQGRVNNLESQCGNETLETVAQTLSGGINELNTKFTHDSFTYNVNFSEMNVSVPHDTGSGITTDGSYLYVLTGPSNHTEHYLTKIDISSGTIATDKQITETTIGHDNDLAYHNGYIYVCDTSANVAIFNAADLSYVGDTTLPANSGGFNFVESNGVLYLVLQRTQANCIAIFMHDDVTGYFKYVNSIYVRKTSDNPQGIFADTEYIYQVTNLFNHKMPRIMGNYIQRIDYNGNISAIFNANNYGEDIEFESCCIYNDILYVITNENKILYLDMSNYQGGSYNRLKIDEWYQSVKVLPLFRSSYSAELSGYPFEKLTLTNGAVLRTRLKVTWPADRKYYAENLISYIGTCIFNGEAFPVVFDANANSFNCVINCNVTNDIMVTGHIRYAHRATESGNVRTFQMAVCSLRAINLNTMTRISFVTLGDSSDPNYDYTNWKSDLDGFFSAINSNKNVGIYGITMFSGAECLDPKVITLRP